MAEEELDELFRRFVQKRDVGAVGELFDSAAPQLARIAWHLTHDANGVEDLVQATFLTALGSAREFDVERRVMPWLLGILVNHARSARRVAGRKPEVLAADVVDTRTPEAELERREVREVVERAVAELPDTYREVVSTWLIEGATPTEIAHRTGKPAATVRVQLHRGLELLRSGLPAGVAGLLATNGWSASSFAASREVVLNQAARLARTLAPTSALVAGGVLMTSKWLFLGAAALVTAAGVGWFVHSNTAQPTVVASAPVVNTNELQVPAPTPSVVVEQRNEVAAPPTSNAREAVATPAPGCWLVGEVDGASAGDHAHLTSHTGGEWSADVVGAHFEVEAPAILQAFRAGARGANSFTVRYDSPRFMPTHVQVMVPESINLEADYTKERVELHAQFAPKLATLVVTGRVVVPRDVDVLQAAVALCALNTRGQPGREPMDEARCAADGAFRVRSASTGAHALVAVHAQLRPATRSIAADTVHEIDLGGIPLDTGEHLAGSVQGSERAITLMAKLTGSHGSMWLESFRPSGTLNAPLGLAWVNGSFEWSAASVTVDAARQFRIEHLAPVEYRVSVWGRSDEPIALDHEIGRLELTSFNDDPVFVASRDGITIDEKRRTIRLDVRANGQPVDGAKVSLGFGGSSAESGTSGHLMDLVWNGNQSATARVSKEGWATREIVIAPEEAVAGAVRVVELSRDNALASLVLRPVVSCSSTEDNCAVALVAMDRFREGANKQNAEKEFSLRDTEWRFDGLVPGAYRVDVQVGSSTFDTSWCLAPHLEVALAPGESAVRDLALGSGGRFAFTIRDVKALSASVTVGGDERMFRWQYFDSRTGRTERAGGSLISAHVGERVELTTLFAPGPQTLTITLDDAERTERTRTVEIVPGKTIELIVDFGKPDER